MSTDSTQLKRSMGLIGLTLYGIGDMLGSGIYALIGKYAGTMGNTIWLAFLGSAVAAGLTGLTYASLGSRYPRAAGAAYVTHRAFNIPMLSYVLGLAIMASGLTSMATATHGVARYALGLFGQTEANPWRYAIMAGFILLVTLINFRGIKESTWSNIICTLIEVGGLAVIVFVGVRYWGKADLLETPMIMKDGAPTGVREAISPLFIMSGAVLTFYSFVGFEDMLNVSEEVKNPQKVFPLGVILAVAFTTLIYMAVAITAVSVVPHDQLAKSNSPLVDVVRVAAPWFPPVIFTAVSIFAIANTALLNYIMGSRLVYGMARHGMLPAVLGKVHSKRQTPHVAILTLMVIVSVLVFTGNIKQLASATGVLLLTAFAVVNVAWIFLCRRPGEPKGGFEVHWLVSAAGALVCSSLIAMQILDAYHGDKDSLRSLLIAAALVAIIAVIYLLHRPKVVVEEE